MDQRPYNGTLLHHPMFRRAQTKIPVAGKIRPGIKVLTSKAKQGIPGAQDIYAKGIESGNSYEAIDAQLLAAARKAGGQFQGRSALTPQNTGSFRVFRSDFADPTHADKIMELYGEGEGENRRLYRLPVVFGMDDINLVLRQNFMAWRASELVFWSQIEANGTIACMTRADLDKNRRQKRTFGGRPEIKRRDCDPNRCEDFGEGRCKLSASLYFHVPGVSALNPIELPFTSIYAAMDLGETLDMVRQGRGSIKGLIAGQPFFYLSKREEEVSVLNYDTNKAERKRHHIIKLWANIDVIKVLQGMDITALPAPDQSAMMALPPPHESRYDPEDGDYGEDGYDHDDGSTLVEHEAEDYTDHEPQDTDTPPHNQDIDFIKAILGRMGVSLRTFYTYACSVHGTEWNKNPVAVKALLDKAAEAERSGDKSAFIPDPF